MRYSSTAHRYITHRPVRLHRRRPLVQSTVWRITSVAVAVVATLSLMFAGQVAVAAGQQGQPTLPIMQIQINGKALAVEMATSGEQRYMGLSFRPSMPDDSGMLFVYQSEQPLTFTMRNTLIPLSIAFISKEGLINEIHRMDVGPNQYFPSDKPAQYALEVNQGWFARNNIKPGARIIFQ